MAVGAGLVFILVFHVQGTRLRTTTSLCSEKEKRKEVVKALWLRPNTCIEQSPVFVNSALHKKTDET